MASRLVLKISSNKFQPNPLATAHHKTFHTCRKQIHFKRTKMPLVKRYYWDNWNGRRLYSDTLTFTKDEIEESKASLIKENTRVNSEVIESNLNELSKQINNMRLNRNPKFRMKLQPCQQTPYLECPSGDFNEPMTKSRMCIYKEPTIEPSTPKYKTPKNIPSRSFKIKSPGNLTSRYYLPDSFPKDKSVDNICQYFYERYKVREKTVLPHLQPNRQKPFGMGESQAFPKTSKSFKIMYPKMEEETYLEKVKHPIEN